MIFGERIKQLRENQNITQNELAEILGISRSSITKYERSEREPGFDILMKVADYFSVSVDYILGKTDEKDMNTHLLNKILIRIKDININAFNYEDKELTDEQKIAINGLLYEYLSIINEDNPISLDLIYLTHILSTAMENYYYTMLDIIFDTDEKYEYVMREIGAGELLEINDAKERLNSVFKNCADKIYSWALYSDIDYGLSYNIDEIVEKFFKNKKGGEFIKHKAHIYEMFRDFKPRK